MVLLVGGVDRGIGAEDDLGHQPGQSAEGEVPGVLAAGMSLEEVVEGGVAEGSSDGGTDEDCDRALVEELL